MPGDDREPRVRLRDWFRQAGLAHPERSPQDEAASAGRMRAASDAVRAALNSIEGITPVERRQALLLLAGYEATKAIVNSGVLDPDSRKKEPKRGL